MNTTETVNRIEELAKLGFEVLSGAPMGEVEEGNWPCIVYRTELRFKNKRVIVTDYKLGVGFVNIRKARPDSAVANWTQEEQSMIYAWQRNPSASFKDKELQARIAAKLAKREDVKPQLDDVLHSLLSDAGAFFNAQSFEDWANEYGYDPDSRKAEVIYKECDNTGRKLSAVIPKDILEKAQAIVQDM